VRILCLTSRLPYPPDRGDRLRAFHFIEHLSQEHELTLVSFIADESEREHLAALEAHCQDVHVIQMSPRLSALTVAGNIWRREPLQVLYYRLNAMRRLVDELTATTPFEASYVHLFRMAPYVVNHPELYRIVDLTDVISREIDLSLPYRGFPSRLVYQLEKPRIARYERWVARTFEETWLISKADQQLLAPDCPGANIQVISNGVDLDQFHPIGQTPQPNSLIFVGHLRVFHNIDAATYLVRDLLPLVRQQVPDCTLQLVGADPDPLVVQFGRDPAVTVTGYVPDLNEHLNRCAVFVAPLRFAAGIQNKALEAMASGRPVVTTTLINQGLGARPGHDIFIADDTVTMAQQIVTLFRDEGLREQIGQQGRQFVERNYTWNHVVERVRVIEETLTSRREQRLRIDSRWQDRQRGNAPDFPSGRNVL
jgi:sugar transferase (PEP-CTERM/EpsH1 system associated)